VAWGVAREPAWQEALPSAGMYAGGRGGRTTLSSSLGQQRQRPPPPSPKAPTEVADAEYTAIAQLRRELDERWDAQQRAEEERMRSAALLGTAQQRCEQLGRALERQQKQQARDAAASKARWEEVSGRGLR
jgi:hypothetical protein